MFISEYYFSFKVLLEVYILHGTSRWCPLALQWFVVQQDLHQHLTPSDLSAAFCTSLVLCETQVSLNQTSI